MSIAAHRFDRLGTMWLFVTGLDDTTLGYIELEVGGGDRITATFPTRLRMSATAATSRSST